MDVEAPGGGAGDGQGGYRVFPGGEKTRRILEAHEEAITDYREVFSELAK